MSGDRVMNSPYTAAKALRMTAVALLLQLSVAGASEPSQEQIQAAPTSTAEQPSTPMSAEPARKSAAEEPVSAPRKPAAKPKVAAKPKIAPVEDVPAQTACTRLGLRVVTALARDDVGNANQFYTFYNGFGCTGYFLTQAFNCVLAKMPADASSAQPVLVSECWTAVTGRPTPVKAAKRPAATH